MPLSVSRRVDPALVLIAAAPIITQSKGVIFSAPTVKKDHAISQRRHENCVESNPDALQHMLSTKTASHDRYCASANCFHTSARNCHPFWDVQAREDGAAGYLLGIETQPMFRLDG